MKTALILIAHGSREGAANEDLLDVAEQVQRRRLYDVVVPAFLELAVPTIQTAAASCVTAGAKKIVLVPYFLSAGVHVRHDLTNCRDELAKNYPEVRFDLAEPLGRSEQLVDLVIQRAGEAGAS